MIRVLYLLLILFLIFIRPVSAATVTFTGVGTTLNWATGANWSTGSMPTAADDVVINNNSSINIGTTYTIKSLTMGNDAGTSIPTLIFNYDAITNGPLTISSGNLTVGPSATITHSVGTSIVVGTVNIDVTTGNADIKGSINANAKGYASGKGPGTQSTTGNAYNSGGSHGGTGGGAAGTSPGPSYGSVTQPTTMGSGGGHFSSSFAAGAGGGAIKLTIGSTLTITTPGQIISNGGDNPQNTFGPGGGAGGSVYLVTNTLSGDGVISANGGRGYGDGSLYAGAGGGGRIAIYYQVDNSTITTTAYGNTSGRCFGGAGTIYKKPSSQTSGNLLVDNNNKYQIDGWYCGITPVSVGLSLDTLIVQNYGNIGTSQGASLSYNTLNWSNKGIISDSGGTFPLVANGNGFTIPQNSILFANYPRALSNLTIDGLLSHSNNFDTEVSKINLTISGNLTIGASGSINVYGRGYYGGFGPGAPSTTGGGTGGAGHGGVGGNGNTYLGGSSYDSLLEPSNLGSGGGQFNNSTFNVGGRGGGAIKLNVGGTLTVNGPILAVGTSNVTANYNPGGGSGGSIYIIANTLIGSGTLSVSGGNGYSSFGGGGGGGRLAIYYTNNFLQSTITATAGSGYQSGTSGTTFKKAISGNLISSPFDTGDPGTILSDIRWEESLSSGTDIKFQIRTAPDSNGSPGTWTSWLGPNGTDSYYTDSDGGETINPIHADVADDQWFQYQAFITASIGDSNIPTLSDVTVEYVVNTPPSVTLDSVPSQNTQGTISLSYSASDPEESIINSYLLANIGIALSGELASGTTAPIAVTNYSYLPTSGSIFVDSEMIGYSGKSGNTLTGISRAIQNTRASSHTAAAPSWFVASSVSGNIGSSLPISGQKTVVWTPRNDIVGLETSTATLKILVNDGNAANQLTSATSSQLTIDTKAPINGDVVINSRTDKLSVSATDSNSIFMKISNDPSLSSDGLNSSSGQWIGYTTPVTWQFSAPTEVVYLSLKDQYNNEIGTSITTTAPARPANLLIQDASNPSTGEWRLFFAWAVASPPSLGFDYYQVYRSTNNIDFTPFVQIDDINQNYYLDSGLDSSKTYYYKITTIDDHGNESNYNNTDYTNGSASKSGTGLTPDGSGGGDFTPPSISNLSVSSVTTTTATIVWTTDELSDSKIGYSTNTSYSSEIGSISMTTNHSITLSNLTPNTKYYFRAISFDAVSNKSTKEDSSAQFFTTTADTSSPVISNIKSVTGEITAGITWATDKASDSLVEYGLNTSYPSSTSSADLVLGHSLAISGLVKATTYYYRVKSVDANGYSTTSPGYTFLTTSTTQDVSAPTISDIAVSDITLTSAKIYWKTSENADGKVEYGESISYERGIAEGNHDLTSSKNVTLIGLSPETTYHYRITATDASGNVNTSADASFTTASQTTLTSLTENGSTQGNAPSVSSDGPSVSGITGTSAIIKWTTNKKSTSQVFLKIKGSLETPVVAGDASVFLSSHNVTLNNLSPATTYEYQVKSADVNGNYVISSKSEFTTSMPGVANVKVASISENSATISWSTLIPTTSNVEYTDSVTGETKSYKNKSLVLNHEVNLVDLYAAALYTFNIIVNDEAGNSARSTQYSFTTKNDKNGPAITSVNSRSAISSQDKVQTVVSWTTSEPSTSKVEYSLGGGNGNYEFSTKESPDYVTNHIVVISNLKAASVYRFRAVSQDRSSNTATSDPYVLLTPQKQVTALDLILQNLEGAFGWTKKISSF